VFEVDFKRLAAFRLALREFQFFSEQAAEAQGLTAQQYQALLAIKGEAGDAPFTVSVLAQRLLVKHNSAVGLVDRMAQLGLVERRPAPVDRRSVVIAITARGEGILRRLAKTHREELHRSAPELGRHVRHFARAREPGG
jgi:DNA-binding MarR family transcriptional regulator